MRLVGKNGRVRICTVGGAFTEVLAVRRYALNVTVDTLDVTAMGDAANEYISGPVKYTGTVEAWWESTESSIVGDPPLVHAGGRMEWEFGLDRTNGANPNYSGVAYITGVNTEVAVDGAISYTCEFQGEGPLDYPAFLA